MYKFDVFLVTHNHLEQTINCVNALYNNTQEFPFRLTVLDDSTDETPHYFKRISLEKGNIQYINPKIPFRDPGDMFTRALKKTDSHYIVCMTNSCRVEPGWVGSALAIMDTKDDVGVVGFKTVRMNGTIENAGILVYGGLARNIGKDEPGHRFSFVYEADAVGSNCCLFRREAVKQGFDYSFYIPFGGFEDIDYCLQLKERGWKILYCGYGAVYHDGAATRGDNPAFWDNFNENKKRFDVRWKHLLDRDISYIKTSQ